MRIYNQWEKWFAWYPVEAYDFYSQEVKIVWMRTVYRKYSNEGSHDTVEYMIFL